jgi:NAD(P)H-hydrate epimerase
MEPFFGAAMAVYLHGRCGDEAAKELGQASLMAGNLIDYLPAVLK